MINKNNPKIVILGGGPTGLGAAYRLHDLGYSNWELYEKESQLGGTSVTHTDPQGFKWDMGGHVMFSHYEYYDNFIDRVLGNDYYTHERESWVVLKDQRIPYPFQNNIRYLSKEEQVRCLKGLAKANEKKVESADFREWILNTFGEGIADIFMYPYNFKVWATPPEKMSHQWIAERVSVPDFGRALENVIYERDEVAWGPNNKFLFPKYGGTGEIYKRAGALIGSTIIPNKKAIEISLTDKVITFEDGSTTSYDYLITTIPLPELFKMVSDVPTSMREVTSQLTHNSVLVIGIGVEKKIETSRCWEYYADIETPFNRLTYFHNYSPDLVPGSNTEKFSSLMLEVCYSESKPINKQTVVQDSIDALVRHGVLEEGDKEKIISKTVYDLKYGYPVPTQDRNDILRSIQPFLLDYHVYSRGRFGAWKYEIANMDHSFMQGVEAVNKIINDDQETTWTL